MIARGVVCAVARNGVAIAMPPLSAGTCVRIACGGGWKDGVVSSASDAQVHVAVMTGTEEIAIGARAEEVPHGSSVVLGTSALGRSIDARGIPLDGGNPLRGVRVRVPAPPVAPIERGCVNEPLWTGVRAIDTLLTLARGARVGIFGSPGAGKSTLLETIVAGTRADAVVVALVGERGREAERWIRRCDARTTIVCATSDRCAGERIAAAHTAFAHARALARRGLDVLLILDSLARVAYALREERSDEPAGRGGYPASVFASVAQLVESAGAFSRGSVSLLATVLSDGDERDPVSEAARSLLDGHIELSSKAAHAGRFPAIDILASSSRTMPFAATPAHLRGARIVRSALASLHESEDLRSLGVEPRDPWTTVALAHEPKLEALLRQGRSPERPADALAMLFETADTLGEPDEYRF